MTKGPDLYFEILKGQRFRDFDPSFFIKKVITSIFLKCVLYLNYVEIKDILTLGNLNKYSLNRSSVFLHSVNSVSSF